MSRKPTIKISYPEASEKALQLTEAMVKRAPGKRVVETESEDPIFPDGGELFSGFIRCKTQTGVELTLTLNSSSMDYALETLIKPNLTADERKRILGEDSEQTELALTPGEQEKKIEIGKIPDTELRIILTDLVDAAQGYVQGGPDAWETWEKHIENAIETAIKEINHRAGVIDLDETYKEEEKIEVGKISEKDLRAIISEAIEDAFKGYGNFDAIGHAIAEVKKRIRLHEHIEEDAGLVDDLAVLICGAQRVQPKKTTELRLFAQKIALYLHEGIDDEDVYVVTARELERVVKETQHDLAEHPGRSLASELETRVKARFEADEIKGNLPALEKTPTWEDVEAEARKIGQRGASEPTDDGVEDDGEIEPGLLNDIEDSKGGEDNG